MRNTSLYRLLVGQVEGFGPQTVLDTLAEVLEDYGYGKNDIQVPVLLAEVQQPRGSEPTHPLRGLPGEEARV